MSNSKRIFGKDYNDYLLAARKLMQGGVRACLYYRLNR